MLLISKAKAAKRGIALLVLIMASSLLLYSTSLRLAIRAILPAHLVVMLNGFRLGYEVDYGVRIRMPDNVELAASLYRPRGTKSDLPTVLVRLPYGRLKYSEGLRAAEFFAARGYAVLIQDLRGTYDSGGEFIPYKHATEDGAATLDWIIRQSWSNGRVGTYGCSALGETQFSLARARHPAHRAMIAAGAGGALGTINNRHGYFGIYEGGIFQLASGFGWFAEYGAQRPEHSKHEIADKASFLRKLPLIDLVDLVNKAPNSYRRFLSTPPGDSSWRELDFAEGTDTFRTPALVINTWGDQTVGDTLALDSYIRSQLPPELAVQQHVVIAPGTHCHFEESGRDGVFGELKVENAAQPYFDWYLEWFDYWLRDKGSGLATLPSYLFYVIGEGKWISSSKWPPEAVRFERWFLSSHRGANSKSGDGFLATTAPTRDAHDSYVSNPLNPVMSYGGPLCCTGNVDERSGPTDQSNVESRSDVLVYTSAPLQQPLRIAGPIRAVLRVSSSALDTDFVARLVHVWPDGRATSIQEGALRARYRQGMNRSELLRPGNIVEVIVDMRAIAYYLPAGHRVRLDIASSSFPRLERNLQTGGKNYDETIPIIAQNRVFHGPSALSWLEVPVLP